MLHTYKSPQLHAYYEYTVLFMTVYLGFSLSHFLVYKESLGKTAHTLV